tara:strand:- start:259 stop:783 length:525 start_codon:yes stop_codon:yes gene_type:complete
MRNKIKLLTLGHQDKNKNVIEFIEILNNDKEYNYEYVIYGKIEKKTFIKLLNTKGKNNKITIFNQYIDNFKFNSLLKKADFIIIPNSTNYKFLQSGVIWDCFQNKKFFAAPENEINKHYLSKYNVGLTYFKEKKILKNMYNFNKKKNFKNFMKLNKDFSFKKNSFRFEKVLKYL